MISEDSTLGGYPEGGGRLDAKSSKPDYGNGGHGDGGWRRHQHQSRRAETARVRKRKERERVDVKLPVVFNRDLAPGHAAFLLAEILRHVLFMRGQLPMPYQQLLNVLEEREESDRVSKEEKGAGVSIEAPKASRGTLPSEDVSTNGSRRRAKGRRPLAKATAHRRARKTLAALEENTLSIEQAFSDAVGKGRPVLEALILMGASHLSPREVYSVIFPEPTAEALRNTASGHDGNSGGIGSAQGRSLADAYSKKLVRCLVGGMSGVTFRALGSCRVHIFLRIADAPDQSFGALPEEDGRATSNSTTSSDSKVNVVPIASFHRGSSSTTPPATLARLSLHPRFKIRTSRTRPAPKVSILLSKKPATKSYNEAHPTQAGTVGVGFGSRQDQEEKIYINKERGCTETADERGRGEAWGGSEDNGGGQRGMWYQLACARLAGLKGCDSLANRLI